MTILEHAVVLLVVVFMVGSLLGLGLQVALGEALRALRDSRFVLLTLIWGFVISPALAWALTMMVPVAPAYATGLVLLGLAPGAPFVPMMVSRARGDLAYAGALMLLTAVGTVVVMPFAVPLLTEGLTADAGAIARPLVLYVLVPLAAGLACRARWPGLAAAARPWVKRGTSLATALMLAALLVVYGADMWDAVGSYAIGTQVLLFGALTLAPYHLSFGLAPTRRSVLGLGIGTRNIGAAMAPLVAVPGTDPRAIVMCALAVIVTVVLAAGAARRFGDDVAPAGSATNGKALDS